MTAAEEFNQVLSTIEQDHELVLQKIRVLRGALDRLLEPEEQEPRQILARLQEANRFFATSFADHMREEERTLFRFLEKHSPGDADVVTGLREDHAKISRMREEWGNCLHVAFELEDGPPRQVLRDLFIGGWELLEYLDQHAQAETRAVRRCLGHSFPSMSPPPREQEA
jgi:hypothetical protein